MGSGTGGGGTRGARGSPAPGDPVPGAAAGRGPGGSIPGVSDPRRRGGRGAVAGRGGGDCPKPPLPGAAGRLRAPPGPRGRAGAHRPGLVLAPPLPGPGRGVWKRSPGAEGRGRGRPAGAVAPPAGTPEGSARGQSPRGSRSCVGLGITPDRRAKSSVKKYKLPLYLPPRPRGDHTQGPDEPSRPPERGRGRTTELGSRQAHRRPARPRGRTGPRPPRGGPDTGLRGSTRLLPAASQLGRGFSKERGAIDVNAGSQGLSPHSPTTHQVKPQSGGEDGGLGAARMGPVASAVVLFPCPCAAAVHLTPAQPRWARAACALGDVKESRCLWQASAERVVK